MKRDLAGILLALSAAIPSAHAELVREPTKIGTNIDIGQIVKGEIYDGSSYSGVVRRQTLTRTGIYLTESGIYNERLTIRLSIGGLFWFAIPETKDFQDRRVQFGPGVGQAQGLYAFGSDPSDPAATLQFGLFSHKYSESVNLGEYLHRSGTYPGTLISGGWSYINAASYLAQGLRLTVPLFDGKLQNELTLYMERNMQPANDLSPGYMLTYKPSPILTLGAGVVWSHAISLNGKRLSPKTDENAYNKVTKLPVKGESGTPTPDSLKGYYTFKGFKTAARASLDIGAIFSEGTFKPGEFGMYSEIALLGVENQPYYYENRAHRRPIMFGLNIPTFGLLDRLTFEYEHLASPFPNSNVPVLQGQNPVPVDEPYVTSEDGVTSLRYDINSAEYNDPKWTVYAKRKVIEGVSIHGQMASDHLRHFNRSAIPGAQAATTKSNEWYYIIRLEFGI